MGLYGKFSGPIVNNLGLISPAGAYRHGAGFLIRAALECFGESRAVRYPAAQKTKTPFFSL